MKNWFLYLTVFITGATVLIIEILGTRLLSPFYGSTIFVWSSLISISLGSLSIGYWWGGHIADKRHSISNFYLIIFSGGLSLTAILQYKKFIILFADNFGLIYGPLIGSVMFFALPLTLLGMASPYAIRLITKKAKQSGHSSGRIFAFSTIGSLVGALSAGFLLIPLLSVSGIFSITSIVVASIAVLGVLIHSPSKANLLKLGLILLLAGAVFGAGVYAEKNVDLDMGLMSHGVFNSTETVFLDRNFYGNYEVIGLPKVKKGKLCLLIDGTNQGCINPRNDREDRNTGSPYSLVSLFMENLPPDSDVLVLGAGAGEYFYYWAREDLNFDVVDINPSAGEVMEASGVSLGKNYNLITDDARGYLLKIDKTYDVIWNDMLGNAEPVFNMMTKESYDLIKSRLNPQGFMITNLFGRTDGEDQLMNNTLATIDSVFPSVIFAPQDRDQFFTYTLIFASKKPWSVGSINSTITTERQRRGWGPLEYKLATPSFEGRLITDEFNPAPYLWAKNIENSETVASFRRKFKRLTEQDYEYK